MILAFYKDLSNYSWAKQDGNAMARMSEKKDKEFQELSHYLIFFATTVLGIPEDDETHPRHHLTPVPGKVTKSQLLSGLRQAVNDTIEFTQDLTSKEVQELDTACRKQHVLTLSEVRRRYWRKYKAIIEKHRIRNDTDYYLVAGVLSDTESPISDVERDLLQTLVSVYEERKSQQMR